MRRFSKRGNSCRTESYNNKEDGKQIREIRDAVVFVFVGYDDSYGDFWVCVLLSSKKGRFVRHLYSGR